jgi:hypothetical protein
MSSGRKAVAVHHSVEYDEEPHAGSLKIYNGKHSNLLARECPAGIASLKVLAQ